MLTVELVGGGLYSGDVFVNGRPVCDYNWDLTDAGVVCGSRAGKDLKSDEDLVQYMKNVLIIREKLNLNK